MLLFSVSVYILLENIFIKLYNINEGDKLWNNLNYFLIK